ncbi:hypothetical protein E2I00_009088 [Balaenoptera physalus]|uniref:Uncharacterized protein n=1 Tax=Balaenoptera physalus TaxID=9770 RepID=A0A6A1QK90_BALPH|nr:hypothetical protein E2I00_009088 [Balaenoptera physalus]
MYRKFLGRKYAPHDRDMYSSEKRWTADLGVVPDRDHEQRHLQSWFLYENIIGLRKMAMKYFLECEMTLKGDIWLLSREIPFRMIPVLNYIDETLKMLLNKYYEGVSSLKFDLSTDSNQDVAVKLAQERAEIVAKYDRGREGAEIEPWEDADYLVYKVTDRFGFLHEEELPYHNAAMERQKHLEIERTTKWLKMLKGWEKYKNTEKVIKNVTSL